MHQLAHQYANGRSHGNSEGADVGIVLLLANALDCEAMLAMLSRHQRIDVLAASSDVDYGLARCQRLGPQVLILDPKIGADSVQRAASMIRSRHIRHLLVLDDRLHEGRLTSLLAMPAVSYLTRQAGFEVVLEGILQVASGGNRVFDPAVQQRLSLTSDGLQLKQSAGKPSLALLTSRELQVMKLLANGNSVRCCAERLDLAESTIDNHKSRLMKKLDIHKTVELTHVAIRQGLIVV